MKLYFINLHYSDSYSKKITTPPLGAGYVLESLNKNHIDTRYYEFSLNSDLSHLINDIEQFSPSLIGFSFMSHFYKESYRMIDKIASLNIPIVCGGVHVNSRGSKVLLETKATFLIKGEGEESLFQLIKNLDNIEKYPEIPGLIYLKNGKIHENPPKIIDLAKVQYPKYRQFDLQSYSSSTRLILTSRGCPYLCTYCQQAALLSKKWRKRSSESILEELEYWATRRVTSFNFADDNLTLDQERIRELCRLIRKSKYKFRIAASGVRIDNADYDTLKMMKDSGFFYLSYGIESGNDRVLKEIKKGITVSQIHKTLEISCRLGFDIKLYFIINNRTETYLDVQDSFKLARQYPISIARFTNLIPFPGTYDYDWIKKNGEFLYHPNEYLNNLPEYVDKPLYNGPGMTLEERIQVIEESKIEIKKFEPKFYKNIKSDIAVGLNLIKCKNYKNLANKIIRRMKIWL